MTARERLLQRRASVTPLFSPIYTVRLRPEYDDGIHGLRSLLKLALRHYGLRCIAVTAEKFEASGPRLSRRARRSSRFGNPNKEGHDMDQSDLDRLRRYAASTRSSQAFSGTTYLRWDYKTGRYLAGKNGVDYTGKSVVADIPDCLSGFQRLESGQRPLYALVRVLGADKDIERNELGDDDPARWADPEKDPWVGVTVLPLFDPDSHQVFVFNATYGARSAASNLIDAFVDHAAAHPEAADQLPLVRLGAGEYPKTDGTVGYAVQLDVAGWIGRPAAVLHITPPARKVVAESVASNGQAASQSAPDEDFGPPSKSESSESKSHTPAGAKTKTSAASIKTHADMDDEIPF